MGSQNGLPSLRYSGLPPAQPLRLAFADPTDRYLRAGNPFRHALSFDQERVLSASSPSFSLFHRPPSPPSWSWKLEPNPTAIREKLTERQKVLEIAGNITSRTFSRYLIPLQKPLGRCYCLCYLCRLLHRLFHQPLNREGMSGTI